MCGDSRSRWADGSMVMTASREFLPSIFQDSRIDSLRWGQLLPERWRVHVALGAAVRPHGCSSPAASSECPTAQGGEEARSAARIAPDGGTQPLRSLVSGVPTHSGALTAERRVTARHLCSELGERHSSAHPSWNEPEGTKESFSLRALGRFRFSSRNEPQGGSIAIGDLGAHRGCAVNMQCAATVKRLQP